MITTAAEYYSKLYDIQQSSSLKNDLRIPSWDYIKSYDGFNSKEKYYTDEVAPFCMALNSYQKNI